MRKAVVALFVVGLLSGPLANISSAGIVCNVLHKLGYENVKDCEIQP